MAKQSGNGTAGRRLYGKTRPKTAGNERKAGNSAASEPSNLLKVVSEAEVTAVEAHPKQPAMYRVAIRLYGDSGNEILPSHEQVDKSGDWNEEVDALIAGAANASFAGETETVITVHEDTLVSLRLLKGRRLSAEEWETLRQEEDREDAYRSALAILERKARTSKELSDALKRKGFTADIIQSCVQRLQERRMLDDSFYARRFTEQRATGQRKGRRLIRQELLQRGIAKEDADRAVGELDNDVEREAAHSLARKKWPQLKGEIRERKQKLAAFLLRRGFPGGIVKEAVDTAASRSTEPDSPEFDYAFEADDMSDGIAGWDGTDPEEFT